MSEMPPWLMHHALVSRLVALFWEAVEPLRSGASWKEAIGSGQPLILHVPS